MKYKITGIIVSNTSDSNRENLSDLQKNERRVIWQAYKKFIYKSY